MNIAFIYPIFFLSGVAALIFEILWLHQLGLVIGNSVWAASLTLSSFMCGQALGSLIAAKFGRRIRKLSSTFGLLLIIPAIFGFLLCLTMTRLPSITVPIFAPITSNPWLINLLRLAFSFILLSIPTTAMGMTLPIVTKLANNNNVSYGRALGLLYCLNTLGAVAGAICAELVFLPLLGIMRTSVVASVTYLLCTLITFLCVRQSSNIKLQTDLTREVNSRKSFIRHAIISASLLSGAAFMAAEVVWTRIILMFVYGTRMAFAAMLAVALLGIGIGGHLASVWVKKNNSAYKHAPLISCICGITIIIGIMFIKVPVLFYNWTGDLQFLSILPIAVTLVFLTSVASGILFVLIACAHSKIEGEWAKATGIISFANTLGCMIGAICGGFLLLPYFGVGGSITAIAIAYGLTAILIVAASGWVFELKDKNLLAIFVLLSLVIIYPHDAIKKTYIDLQTKTYRANGENVVGYKDAITETILYLQRDIYDLPYYNRLITNSFSMSSTTMTARRYMKLYAYLPVAIHEHIKNALLISYGVGSTAKAMTDTSEIETIDVVDISKDILEMGRLSFSGGGFPLDDKRVNVYIEDGRNFLLLTSNKYDLITAEPPPPKNSGITNLYSEEYFRLIKDRLSQDGIVTYWLPVVQMHEEETRSIIRGFCNVFTNCTLWAPSLTDWMLVGTNGTSYPVSTARFEAQWKDANVSDELQKLGFENPSQLGALFIADTDTLNSITKDAKPLVDDFPCRITSNPTDPKEMVDVYKGWIDYKKAKEEFAKNQFIKSTWPSKSIDETLPYFELQNLINAYLLGSFKSIDDTIKDLHHVLTQTTLTELPLWIMQSDGDMQTIVNKVATNYTADSAILHQLAIGAIAKRDFAKAKDLLEQALKNDSTGGFKFLIPYLEYVSCRLTNVSNCLSGR